MSENAVCGTVGTGSFACRKPFSPSPPSRHSLPRRLPAPAMCRCTCERSRSARGRLRRCSRSQHFNMLAVHWIGTGTVAYRTRKLHGVAAPGATRTPDNRTGCLARRQPRLDGRVGRLQFRVAGTVARLRSYEVWSRVTGAPARALSQAGTPAIVTRAAWGANEEIVRARPSVAPAVRLAVIHHTAGTNSYTRAQAAAIVRGIEVYHVQGNGWNDIGYNFLVDRFGTVYEGRGGGVERNVIGAHARRVQHRHDRDRADRQLLERASPPLAQQNALAKLLAWRLDVAHVDPLSTVVYTSGGNAKFRAGRVVTLRAISGHRDTGPSECPGARAYALLPGARAARRADRAAEAVLADGDRLARRARPVPGAALVAARVDGHRRRPRSASRSPPAPAAARASTGRGPRRWAPRAATRGRSARRGSGSRPARSASPAARPAGPRLLADEPGREPERADAERRRER